MKKFNEMNVKELKNVCRKKGISGYSKLRKAELIAVLEEYVNSKKQALKEAKTNAQEELGKDFGRALIFWKNLKGIKRMSIQDYSDMTESWVVISALVDEESIVNSTVDTAKALAELFAPDTDVSKYSADELNEFISECINIFISHTTTERLKKDNMTILKMSMEDVEADSNGDLYFDSTIASVFTPDEINVRETPQMRIVGTSEDGISRMLHEKGLSSVTMYVGLQSVSSDIQKMIDDRKRKLFTEGVTDVTTGKHYMPAFQNPSSVRQANMMFVEAQDWDEIMKLWLEITGLKTWENFSKAFFDKEGKVVLAKLLARVSCRGSNSFDTSKVSKKWSDEIKKARVYYVEDPSVKIIRDYKTLDRPGHLEMVKDKARVVTPGDGQGEASFSECALFAVNMRIFSEDEYEEFMRLWKGVGMDETKVKEGSRLDKLIKKMPLIYQIRHGEKKGILVRVNLERFKATKDIDIIIPDSVRKFIGGEWKDYPLEICNYLKKKGKYVSMNAQFIQALHYDNPNTLNTIVDEWFDLLNASLTDIAKAQMFHGIIRYNDEEDADIANILVQALRTSSDLVDEAQICNWRKKQYHKFIDNMKMGKILIPGMYSYEICDPYSLLNKWFGLDIPCLAEGEFYHNGLTCECGLFRSPLIAPFEATKVQLVEHDTYRYMRDVIVFNTEDGVWDRLGGSDFDGDTCAIVPDNTKAGHIIVSGIRTIDHDVWEPAQKAKKVKFDIPNLIEHLVKTAMRDRTGMITNYATNAQDIANHLRASVYFAKLLGCEAITMLHPSAFAGCTDDPIGNDFTPRTATTKDGRKVFQIRGLVKTRWNKRLKKCEFDEGGIYGTLTFDKIEEIAQKYEFIVEYLRILQGREIDGAKTGVYAEGISGKDFVDLVKVIFIPHSQMTRKRILNKPVTDTDALNYYVSLSPLGRIHDYVCKREHEIYDFLENGSNKIFLLQSLMTEQEAQDMSRKFKMQEGGDKNLVEMLTIRKEIYNKNVHNVMDKLSGEEQTNTLAEMKTKEETELRNIASALNVSVETVAVASYIATYTKDSKQNQGLTYAWLLSGELLSVFARGNKKFDLFRLPLSAKEVSIQSGYMYVNGKKYIQINADDCGDVLIWRHEGRPYAYVHKRTKVVSPMRQNNVMYGAQAYTVGAYGFKYHIMSDKPVQTWKELVAANNYVFDITMDATNRAVLSINGRSIGALMAGADFDLMNKKVKIINTSANPIEFYDASIKNLQVIIIGEAD